MDGAHFTSRSTVIALVINPAPTVNVDINSLVEPSPPTKSPGNVSTSSKTSTSSRTRDESATSALASNITTTSSPGTFPKVHTDVSQYHFGQGYHPMQTTPYQPSYALPGAPQQYPSMSAYPPYQRLPVEGPRLPTPVPISLATGPSHKRLAPPHPHPAESPAKKKQSKWTADEDASIIELRGNGMKWEDISKHLPGRSAISCRLRFQNYLERRSEWDEEKKNKLARLYERLVASFL